MSEFYILLGILILSLGVGLFFIFIEKINKSQLSTSLRAQKKNDTKNITELLGVQDVTLQDIAIKQESALSLQKQLASKIIGQSDFVIVLLLALFSGSHVFIQSLPGLAKTSAVKYLCELVGLSFGRIQGTPDLLPSDITGFEMADGTLKSGVINNNLILFDEINRSTPKLQSAILQAMEEKTVTLGTHHVVLPSPFIVFATANPSGSRGVYGLPEAQMDRFGLSITLAYPKNEEQILAGFAGVMDGEHLGGSIDYKACVTEIDCVSIDFELIELITEYLRRTRESDSIAIGCSPRAGKDIIHIAKTLARMQNKGAVLEEDIHVLLPYVWGHRITWL